MSDNASAGLLKYLMLNLIGLKEFYK